MKLLAIVKPEIQTLKEKLNTVSASSELLDSLPDFFFSICIRQIHTCVCAAGVHVGATASAKD